MNYAAAMSLWTLPVAQPGKWVTNWSSFLAVLTAHILTWTPAWGDWGGGHSCSAAVAAAGSGLETPGMSNLCTTCPALCTPFNPVEIC